MELRGQENHRAGAKLWSEGVQPEVVKLLGEDSERSSCRLFLADVEIKLRVGIEGFRLRIALKRRQTRNGTPFVTVLDGFGERNPILHNRPGECDPGRDRSNAHN